MLNVARLRHRSAANFYLAHTVSLGGLYQPECRRSIRLTKCLLNSLANLSQVRPVRKNTADQAQRERANVNVNLNVNANQPIWIADLIAAAGKLARINTASALATGKRSLFAGSFNSRSCKLPLWHTIACPHSPVRTLCAAG